MYHKQLRNIFKSKMINKNLEMHSCKLHTFTSKKQLRNISDLVCDHRTDNYNKLKTIHLCD